MQEAHNAQAPTFELVQLCLADMHRAKQRARAIRKGPNLRLRRGPRPKGLAETHWSEVSTAKSRPSGQHLDDDDDDVGDEDRPFDERTEDLTQRIGLHAPPPTSMVEDSGLRSSGALALSGRRQVAGTAAVCSDRDDPKTAVEGLLKRFANQVARWRQTDRSNPPPSVFAAQLKAQYIDDELADIPVSKMSHIARKAISLEVSKIAKLTQPQAAATAAEHKVESQRQQTRQMQASPGMGPPKANLKFDELLAMCETQQSALQKMMGSS